MITNEDAREAENNVVTSIQTLKSYCKEHDCTDCWFHGEYDELAEEYVCDIGDLLNVRWYK